MIWSIVSYSYSYSVDFSTQRIQDNTCHNTNCLTPLSLSIKRLAPYLDAITYSHMITPLNKSYSRKACIFNIQYLLRAPFPSQAFKLLPLNDLQIASLHKIPKMNNKVRSVGMSRNNKT
jgi:hypothetical protein